MSSYRENFKSDWEQGWELEGEAEFNMASDGFLGLKAVTPYVLWNKRLFKGDVTVEFDAYSHDGNAKQCLFFMAHTLDSKPFFSAKRTGEYSQYAWERSMGMYSLGFLRGAADQDDKLLDGAPRLAHQTNNSNFRFVGGLLKDEWYALFNYKEGEFEKSGKTIEQHWRDILEYECNIIPSAVSDSCVEPGKIHHFTAIKKGKQIQFLVDGRMIHDVTHDDEKKQNLFAPPEEGYIGFRGLNGEIWLNNFEVCDKQ